MGNRTFFYFTPHRVVGNFYVLGDGDSVSFLEAGDYLLQSSEFIPSRFFGFRVSGLRIVVAESAIIELVEFYPFTCRFGDCGKLFH